MVSKKSKKKKKLKKKKKNFFFTFLNWENQTWYWEKRWLFFIWNGAEIRPLEMGRKGPEDPPLHIAYIRPVKKSCINEILNADILCNKRLCATLSKALEKSK